MAENISTRKATPEIKAKVAQDWLKGDSYPRIADRYGLWISHVEVIVGEVRRDLHASIQRTADDVLAEVAMMRFAAWTKWQESQEPITEESVEEVLGSLDDKDGAQRPNSQASREPMIADVVRRTVKRTKKWRTGEATWLNVIQWCLEFEAKIRGLAAPLQIDHSFRVAGALPEDIDAEMLARLDAALAEAGAQPKRVACKVVEPDEPHEQRPTSKQVDKPVKRRPKRPPSSS